jgi:hypothetical protein
VFNVGLLHPQQACHICYGNVWVARTNYKYTSGINMPLRDSNIFTQDVSSIRLASQIAMLPGSSSGWTQHSVSIFCRITQECLDM